MAKEAKDLTSAQKVAMLLMALEEDQAAAVPRIPMPTAWRAP